jgi:hypothetical protein
VDGIDSQVISVTTDTAGNVTGGSVGSYAARVTAVGKGTLPLRCSLIANYRGAIVLANQPNNHSVSYISRRGNPLDWDFGASPLATCALALNDPKIGQVGQNINALIAGRDDYLFYGCESKLYWLVGDPGSGGEIHTLSDQTGVISQRSWCFDENGVLYFMGNAGFYRLRKGGLPENVSGQRMKKVLDRINIATTRVIVRYDSFWRRVMIWLQALDGTLSKHWQYDVDGDNFFAVRYPQRFGPWGACSIVGGEDKDREFLIGGNDGYIQRPNPDALTDDGSEIQRYVRFAPIRLGNGSIESEAVEFHATGVAGTGAWDWFWVVGKSPEDIERMDVDTAMASAVASGTLFEDDTGFQHPVSLKQTGGAHQLILRQVGKKTRGGLEELTVFLAPAGPRR